MWGVIVGSTRASTSPGDTWCGAAARRRLPVASLSGGWSARVCAADLVALLADGTCECVQVDDGVRSWKVGPAGWWNLGANSSGGLRANPRVTTLAIFGPWGMAVLDAETGQYVWQVLSRRTSWGLPPSLGLNRRCGLLRRGGR